jgi:ABC-type glycerol-3-phosphate transport system permease component
MMYWGNLSEHKYHFDYSWKPDPGDPPYCYVFGNQWNPPEFKASIKYVVDGATEFQILFKVVIPMAMPVVATASIITFLLNWSQWLPILVVSKSPSTYTLPVALMNLNGELGVNFQGIMALSVITTLPVILFFLLAQRRVISGMTAGAVKG